MTVSSALSMLDLQLYMLSKGSMAFVSVIEPFSNPAMS